MSSPDKKGKDTDVQSMATSQIKASSPINQSIPILNIPNPGGSSTPKSPNMSSPTQKSAKNSGNSDEPEVMVLDDDEEMDNEGDGVADESFGSVGADDGKSSAGGGKLTLKLLLDHGLIEAGEGVMSIDYLGQTFKGDLLPNGQIKSQETGLFFKNPSAWAIYCKKIVNPSKKSGCGWASVKYKGRKMDHFKAVWSSKMKALSQTVHRPELDEGNSNSSEIEVIQEIRNSDSTIQPTMPILPGGPLILRHSQLGPKQVDDNKDTLIEVESFVSVGKVQPFNVSISSSALLLVDLHSHLSPEPVCGYLAGHWDLNAHNLAITHCYPCLMPVEEARKSENDVSSKEKNTNIPKAQEIESEIYNAIYSRHLTLVGWYRSKPAGTRALPSLRDSEAQLDHQIKLLGSSDATYSPCVGMILSPYTSGSTESELLTYWTVPPPENGHSQEYGKPLKMSHAIVTDPCLSAEVLQQIEDCIMFYKDQKRTIKFKDNFNSDTLFITKMGRTLLPKFPRDQDERLWKYIRVLLLGATDDSDIDDPLLIRPPQQLATAPNDIPNSSSVSLSSMTLNGATSVGVNGNNKMATAGLIGPRHMTNNKNSSMSSISNSGKNKVGSARRKTHDSLEEEEIDDDEENAILISEGKEKDNKCSITVTPSSKSLDTRSQMESYGFPSTSFTPTTNPNNSTSSFKSPSSTNLSSGKSSKGPNPATEYPEEISFLLQRPGSNTSRISSSISITKTSKAPENLTKASNTSKIGTKVSSQLNISSPSNPFNISTSSNKGTPSSFPVSSESRNSSNSQANNRGAVEDSDEESLIIHE